MTDRVIVWAGQIPLETDVLRSNKFAMTGIAKLAAAVLGTSATVVNGLACVPTGPATLTVNVNPGEIYSLVSMDATAYSSVAADTTHQILKSGISLDAVNLSCPAPGTAGQSINYLVEAIYQDSDTDLTTLPYYNASNPSSAWSGPNNSGTPQATTRKGTVALVAKAGAAATTGSQTTPAPDAGYTGLWVVTVANGQTQILAGNITQYAGAPILPSSLLASIQNGNLSYAVATGTANAHVVALTPTLTSRVDGMVVRYKAPAANTGALTLNDGLGAVAVVGAAHSALQGGETVQNGDVWVQWNSSIGGGSYIMLDSSGGALQVAPATQSQHAIQLGQAIGRLLKTSIYINNAGTQQVSTYVNGTWSAFTSTGATTFTPLTNTITVDHECVGGGAGGGGATGSSTASAYSGGGGAGTYARSLIPATAFSGATAVTVGAGGAGGSNTSNGSGGSTSSLGSLISCPGGAGSLASPATTGAAGTSGGSPQSSAPTGSYIVAAVRGGGGSYGLQFATSNGIGGPGGSSFFGPGAVCPAGTTTNGNTAINYGAGGSGASSAATNTSGATAGSGLAGVQIMREYA